MNRNLQKSEKLPPRYQSPHTSLQNLNICQIIQKGLDQQSNILHSILTLIETIVPIISTQNQQLSQINLNTKRNIKIKSPEHSDSKCQKQDPILQQNQKKLADSRRKTFNSKLKKKEGVTNTNKNFQHKQQNFIQIVNQKKYVQKQKQQQKLNIQTVSNPRMNHDETQKTQKQKALIKNFGHHLVTKSNQNNSYSKEYNHKDLLHMFEIDKKDVLFEVKLINETNSNSKIQINQDNIRQISSAWIVTLMDELCKYSYSAFLQKQMSQKQMKIFFSRNYIHNYICARRKLRNQCPHLQNQFIKTFQNQSKSSLKFFKLRYPQQEKSSAQQRIHDLIPPIFDYSYQYQKYIINQLGFEKKSFGWKEIKSFLNSIINQTKQKQKLFKETFGNLFMDKGTQIKGLSFAVNSKIKSNSPLYTQQEIAQEGLNIRSPQIMRVIIKWIQGLQESINVMCNQHDKAKNQPYLRQFKNSNQKQLVEDWSTNAINQLLKDVMLDPETKKYEPLKKLQRYQKEIVETYSNLTIQIVDQYKSHFRNSPNEQTDIGLLTSIMSSTISNLASEHLYQLLKRLNIFTQGQYKTSQIFPVFDLFRGKCSGNYEAIKKVYQNILFNKQLKIIKVKNRIDTPNRDFLLNIIMSGVAFVCELQLHVEDNISSKQDYQKIHRLSCENTFNHFLYELERSNYGPLNEAAIVYQSLSEIPSFYSMEKLRAKQPITKKRIFDKNIMIKKSQLRNYMLQYQDPIIIEQLQIEGYKVSRNQSFDFFCSYCRRIYQKSSFQLPYAMSKDSSVCPECISQKMSNEDFMKVAFPDHNSFFKRVTQHSDIKDKKYLILVGKQTKQLFSCKILLYKNGCICFVSSKNQVIQQKNVKIFESLRIILQKYFAFVLNDQTIMKCQLFKDFKYSSTLQKTLSLQDFQLIAKPEYLMKYSMIYIENPTTKKIFLLDFYSCELEKQQKKIIQINTQLRIAEDSFQNKSYYMRCKWQEPGPHLFLSFPQYIRNSLFRLQMSTTQRLLLKNMRCLKILILVLDMKWEQVKFDQFQTPLLQILHIELSNRSNNLDSIDIGKIQFKELKQLKFEIYQNVNFIRFKNQKKLNNESNKDKNLLSLCQDLKDAKHPQLNAMNSLKTSQIQMEIQNNTYLSKLQRFQLKLKQGHQCRQISFNGLSLSGLLFLRIKFENVSKVSLDFEETYFPKLKNLSFDLGFCYVKCLKGFSEASNIQNIPHLESFKLEGLFNKKKDYNISYLNIAKVKSYTLNSNHDLSAFEGLKPNMDFQNLEQLEIFIQDFPFKKVIHPEKLQLLNLNCKLISEILDGFGDRLKALKKLVVKPQHKQHLKLVHNMKQLEHLQIQGFDQINITSNLPKLKTLKLYSNSKVSEINLCSLGGELEVLHISYNSRLKILRFQSFKQLLFLKQIELGYNYPVPKFVQSNDVPANYFWKLNLVLINELYVQIQEFKKVWNGTLRYQQVVQMNQDFKIDSQEAQVQDQESPGARQLLRQQQFRDLSQSGKQQDQQQQQEQEQQQQEQEQEQEQQQGSQSQPQSQSNLISNHQI